MHPYPKAITEFTKKVMRSFMVESGLEPALFGNRFQIQEADYGQVNFSLLIHHDNLNRLKILHGGTIASLVDLGGSLAVASTGRWTTGVSTDINVSYLKAGGREDDLLQGLALCDKIGKSLAYTTVSLRNGGGDLVARGSHTKYVLTPEKLELWAVPAEYDEILRKDTSTHAPSSNLTGFSGLSRPKCPPPPTYTQTRSYRTARTTSPILPPSDHSLLQQPHTLEMKRLVDAMAPSDETTRLRMRYGLSMTKRERWGRFNTAPASNVAKQWLQHPHTQPETPTQPGAWEWKGTSEWKNMWLRDLAESAPGTTSPMQATHQGHPLFSQSKAWATPLKPSQPQTAPANPPKPLTRRTSRVKNTAPATLRRSNARLDKWIAQITGISNASSATIPRWRPATAGVAGTWKGAVRITRRSGSLGPEKEFCAHDEAKYGAKKWDSSGAMQSDEPWRLWKTFRKASPPQPGPEKSSPPLCGETSRRIEHCDVRIARHGTKNWDDGAWEQTLPRKPKPTLPHQRWVREYGPKSDWQI